MFKSLVARAAVALAFCFIVTPAAAWASPRFVAPASVGRSQVAQSRQTRKIYVANFNGASGGGSIESFPFDASGDVAPLVAIAGPKTGIQNPQTVAVGPSGEVFALAGLNFAPSRSIVAFAPGATGNVLPSRVIVDGRKNHEIFSLATDAAGFVYALYQEAINGGNEIHGIDVFAPAAHGTVFPVRTIAGPHTLLDPPATVREIFVDDNANVWWFSDGEVGTERIVGYPAGANGDAAPMRVIEGKKAFPVNIGSVVVDRAGNVYAGTQGPVFVFPRQGSNVVPAGQLDPDCAPSCTPYAMFGTEMLFTASRFPLPDAIVTYDLSRGFGPLRALRTIGGAHAGIVNPDAIAVR